VYARVVDKVKCMHIVKNDLIRHKNNTELS